MDLPFIVEALSFGLSTTLLAVAERLDLINLINQHCPKRQQGISIGQYLVLATINRVNPPVKIWKVFGKPHPWIWGLPNTHLYFYNKRR